VTSSPGKKRLRVLFFESGRRGGSIFQLRSILHHLDPDRFESGFVSWYSDKAAAVLFELPKPFCRHSLRLRFEQPDTVKHLFGVPIPTPFAAYYRLFSERVIVRERPDVVYMNTGIGGHGPAIVAASRRGVPVVCHFRHSRDLNADERRLAGRVTHFVASSRWGARHLGRQLDRPAADVTCAYESIDLRAFDERAERERGPALAAGPLYVCLVGSLIPRKRPLLAIEGFARACRTNPRLRLVIAGDGPLRAQVERSVAAAGLDSFVLRLGSVSTVPALLRGGHVGLLASEAEGMPNAVMEYMAAGLPVVTAAIPGVDELVAPGRTGLIVSEPITPDTIAEALTAVTADDARRVEMGRAGRRTIESPAFRPGTAAAAVADVVERAVGPRG